MLWWELFAIIRPRDSNGRVVLSVIYSQSQTCVSISCVLHSYRSHSDADVVCHGAGGSLHLQHVSAEDSGPLAKRWTQHTVTCTMVHSSLVLLIGDWLWAILHTIYNLIKTTQTIFISRYPVVADIAHKVSRFCEISWSRSGNRQDASHACT